MDYDCRTCGACCAFSADWPVLTTPRDHGPEGPGPEWTDDGHVRWAGDRCAGLAGTVGVDVTCTLYARRPQPCRDCQAGSVPCEVARRAHGLPVDEVRSPLDDLFA